MTLADEIHRAFADSAGVGERNARALFLALRDALERGEVRAAERDPSGAWRVNAFVKEGILLGFRASVLAEAGAAGFGVAYFDRDTMVARRFDLADGVRLVPGGSAVRRGAYVAPGVTIMPPAYINIGAHVGRDTMIDSHALVGGNCGVYEGVIVRRGAVLATGTLLNASTVLFDLVHERELRAAPGAPLEVPAGAVVVPGARRLGGAFAEDHGLCVQTPIIVKYRDARTDARTALESALRQERP